MNTIELAKKYTTLLDEVYMETAKTAVLESDASMSRAGANVNEIIIPKIDMDGLADYDRNSGYVKGNVSFTWETVKFNYERGRMFTVDAMDNEETQGLAFGRLAGEFVRNKVVPELDAFRFATYSAITDIGKKEEPINTGSDAIAAIREAVSAMDEAEVPAENRYLFVTPTIASLIEDMDSYKSRAVMAGFANIVRVPQSRFYTAILLKDGVTDGETEGGYECAADGAKINFMIIHKPAVIQFTKQAVPKIITPALNQEADAYKYGYRSYGLTDAYENKAAGIWCSYAPTAADTSDTGTTE